MPGGSTAAQGRGGPAISLAALLVAGCANHTVAVWQENDSFAPAPIDFTNYSSGLQLTLSPADAHEPCRPRCEQRIDWLADRLNLLAGAGSEDTESTWLRYGMGHQFFTPDDVTVPELQPADRPYAGWLFASLDIVNETVSDDVFGMHTHYRNIVGLRAGIVGPSSRGEGLQKFWHGVCSCDEPQGWRHQLRDEPGFIYSLAHERKFLHRASAAGASIDLIGSANAAVGNVYSGAGIGATLRFGWHMPDAWGATTIEGLGYDSRDPGSRLGISLFAALEGRYVARDIFLDGNTWQHSHSVEREPFVADMILGVGFHWRRLGIRASVTRRTLQYATQAEPQRFGSLAIIWRP